MKSVSLYPHFFLSLLLLISIEVSAQKHRRERPSEIPDTAYLIKSEFVFTKALTPNVHASSIVELPGNKLMVAWFGGTSEGNPDAAIWISTYQKGTWDKPLSVADGYINKTDLYACWNPVLFFSQKKKLFLFYKTGTSPSTWWGMMKTSLDNGQSWTRSQKLPDGFSGPVKNKPVQLANGAILCPSSSENFGWKVHLELTNDSAVSWKKIPVDTATSFDVIQPTILKYRGNKLQLLCRTKQGFIVESRSVDNGVTWSSFKATELPNNNSGIDAVTLSNGTQLLVYNPIGYDGVVSKRHQLNVAASADGSHWHDIFVLENGKAGDEYSYPAIIQTEDGLVHITYTWKRLNIKHVILNVPD